MRGWTQLLNAVSAPAVVTRLSGALTTLAVLGLNMYNVEGEHGGVKMEGVWM